MPELYGKPKAYGVAGAAAAILAGAQMAGSLLLKFVRPRFHTRTALSLASTAVSVVALVFLGLFHSFWAVLTLIVVWGLLFSLSMPVRQAYLNDLIDSQQRATVLSFDSLMGSSGGVVAQPILGRVTDLHGYAASYLVSAVFQAGTLPFLMAAQKQRAAADLQR